MKRVSDKGTEILPVSIVSKSVEFCLSLGRSLQTVLLLLALLALLLSCGLLLLLLPPLLLLSFSLFPLRFYRPSHSTLPDVGTFIVHFCSLLKCVHPVFHLLSNSIITSFLTRTQSKLSCYLHPTVGSSCSRLILESCDSRRSSALVS